MRLFLASQDFGNHADQDWYKADFEANLKKMTEKGVKPIILDDSDVFVVDGDKREVLR